jgi:hypothetical protein
MKTLYKILLVCFLIPIGVDAGHGYDHTKTKKLSKRFDVSKNCEVEVDNSFGSITITTWDKPVVAMDIEVIVSGNNLDRVQERLKAVDVVFQSSNDYVGAQSKNISNNDSGGFWSLFSGKNNSGKIEVNYVIKMPVTGSIDISNDYGAVILDRIEGRANISCDFGRLDLGELMHQDNELRFDYTKQSHVDYIRGGKIQADFSGIQIDRADNIEVKGDYSQFEIQKVEKLDFNGDFTTLDVKELKHIEGRGDYSTTKLGRVSDRVLMTTDFGSIKIDELRDGFSEVTLRSDYTSIDVRYERSAKFNFDVDTEYASINLDNNVELNLSERDGSDKRKAGHVNSRNGGEVRIKSSFGGVTLKSK